MAPWRGRAVLVTGATSGIGRATAARLHALGADVVVHGLSSTDVGRTVDSLLEAGPAGAGRAVGHAGDLRDPETPGRLVAAAVRSTGRLDVLVNNAGANVFRGVLQATVADWSDCLDLDLRAPWLCAAAAAPVMARGGAVVNVTSNHATSTLPGVFPYNVAKAGLEALTQSLAIELAPRGIRVNAVRPGYVDTPVNETYFAGFRDPAAARADAERLHLVGRLGAPDEVARAVEFLADRDSSGFTTGTVLTLDGGRSALLQDPRPDEGRRDEPHDQHGSTSSEETR